MTKRQTKHFSWYSVSRYSWQKDKLKHFSWYQFVQVKRIHCLYFASLGAQLLQQCFFLRQFSLPVSHYLSLAPALWSCFVCGARCSECQGRSQCHNNLSKHQHPPSSQGQRMHMSLCLMIKCSLRDHLGWPVPCTSMSHAREGSSARLSLVGCVGGWLLIGWDWPQMPHSAAAHPCLSCLGRLSQSQGITQLGCHKSPNNITLLSYIIVYMNVQE